MAAQPFLKSIQPVNLLSFGPETEAIELRPLNILIGANGSGKSNFIEMVRQLWLLPETEPWSLVLETGGADEWIWRGQKTNDSRPSLSAEVQLNVPNNERFEKECLVYEYGIAFDKYQTSFRVSAEHLSMSKRKDNYNILNTSFQRTGTRGEIVGRLNSDSASFELLSDRSVLSQLETRPVREASLGSLLPEIYEIKDFFDSFDFHQDWEFGADLTPRDPILAGQGVERLNEDARNLPQMLANFRDYHRPIYEQINELVRGFCESFRVVEVRLIGSHLQIAIQEEGGFSTSGYRLSDGTLRWLALLVILLNPKPAPVTCIDEPELGLHPDMIPTLADLLRDASTRTQLIVTTHSRALVDCFNNEPESVCVCEKVNGATRISRLQKERLSDWLEKYSLGSLWASGEIGGNRW